MIPAILVSVVLNLITVGYILSTYFSSTRREDAQHQPVYQDFTQLEIVPEYGDKLHNWEELTGVGDRAEEQRFDNRFSQDVYYDLPRSFISVSHVDTG